MKELIRFIGCVMVMSIHINVTAQETQTNDSMALKKRIYKAWIMTEELKESTGYLAGLSDSNLYLSSHLIYFSLIRINDNLSVYPYGHLEKILIKRKGAAGRGALQGALFGLAAGVITGFLLGDDPVAPTNNPNDPLGNLFGSISNSFRMTAGEKAVLGGFVGAVAGGVAGAIIGGLVKKKFIIGRSKERFHEMRQNILEKLYLHREEKLQPQE
jgi:hypothetical protein